MNFSLQFFWKRGKVKIQMRLLDNQSSLVYTHTQNLIALTEIRGAYNYQTWKLQSNRKVAISLTFWDLHSTSTILCLSLPSPRQIHSLSWTPLWMPDSTLYFTHAILLNKEELQRYLWVQSMVPWKVHIPWDCRSLLECNFLCFKSSNNKRKNITNSLRKSG